MISLAPLLLVGLAVAQEDATPARDVAPQAKSPRLAAPLAWLVDQDDYPLVSRHLVVLEPGADEATTALKGLLHCFDAADLQAVAWCGDFLYVNGSRPRTRPAPNGAMPLNALRRGDQGWQPVAPWQEGATPEHFQPSPAGDGLLLHSLQRVGFLLAGETRADAARWLLTRENGLGSAQVRHATWAADGGAILVSVKAWRSGMEDGLWRIPVERDDGGAVSGFGEASRVGAARGLPRSGWAAGGVLTTRRNAGRDFYSLRSLLLVRADADADADVEVLVDDLHWNESFAVEPELLGRSDRPPGPPRIAYVRALLGDGDSTETHGAIVLRSTSADRGVTTRELWSGAREADGLAWSPDGRWLAFHARDAERKPQVWVMAVDSGEAQCLGPGLRPAWGPLPEPERAADRPGADTGPGGANER